MRHSDPLTCLTIWLFMATSSIALEPMPTQPLVIVNWKERAEASQLVSGEWLPATEQDPERLLLEHAWTEPRLFPLVEIVPPPITEATYFIRGRIRYQEVAGEGYLEMWNHFPSGAYFTRTLSKSGPLGHISGTSDWREFALPFMKNDEPSPQKLVINLSLPGPGTVELSDLELIAPAEEYTGNALPGAWWSDRTAGLFGGLAGSFLGVFIGCVLAPLSAMGRAKSFTLTAYLLLGLAASLSLLLGLIAIVSAQPYGVCYPLLLIGLLGMFFGFGGLMLARKKYREHELRRMSALDVA